MLIVQLPTPIPSPTPSLQQATHELTNTLQDTQGLINSIKDLSALGVLALIVVLAILYVVLVLRKRKGDDDTLNLQQQQTSALIVQMSADRQERKDLLNRLFERDEQRENKVIESIGALTAAHESFRVGIAEIKAIVTTFNTRDMKRDELDKQRDQAFVELQKNYGLMAEEGSKPVQEIRSGVKKLLEISEAAATTSNIAAENKVDHQQIDRSITELQGITGNLQSGIQELRIAISLMNDHIRTLQKVKTKELPKLSAIVPNEADINPVL